MAAKAGHGHSYRTDICQQCRTAWATLDIPWLSNFLQSLSTPDPTLSRCQTWAPTFFPWLNSPCKTPNSLEQRQKWTTGHELGRTGQRADCSVPTSNIRPSGHLIVPEPCLRSTLSAIHMTHSLVWVVKLKGAAWICLDTATTTAEKLLSSATYLNNYLNNLMQLPISQMHLVLHPVAIELPAICPHITTCTNGWCWITKNKSANLQQSKCIVPSPCMSLFWKFPLGFRMWNTPQSITNSTNASILRFPPRAQPRTCSPRPTWIYHVRASWLTEDFWNGGS